MGRINIRTSVGVNAPIKNALKYFTITRGATSSFTFNLYDKIYDIEDIDQMTFIFKQTGKADAIWYSMFDYIKKTDDTEPDYDKIYYKDVVLPPVGSESNACTGTKITAPEGDANPKQLGWYEVVELEDGNDNRLWILDDHFSYTDGDYSKITLWMHHDETCQFKANGLDSLVQFEIVIRLDTDNLDGLNGRDSIIIEPQPGIIVVDSLYSYITGSNMPIVVTQSICSENLCCSEKLVCRG